MIQNEQSHENTEEQTETVESLVINTINREVASKQSTITFVLLIDDKSPTRDDDESTVQITEINENENKDNNLPHKTPNQLVMYKSPEFRMSDYLVFNKQGESIDLSPFIASTAQSLGSRSPEFRLSDYLSFHRQGSKVYPQLIASPAQSFGSSSPESRLSDCTLFRKSEDSVNDKSLILSPAHSTGYRSPELRLTDYSIFRNQGEKTTYARLIASPIESLDARVSNSTVQRIDCHDKDDEDKENKDDSIEEKEKGCEKDATADGVINTDGNHAKKKRKKGDLQIKSKKTKKSDTPPSTRKSTRKRKLKAGSGKDAENEVCSKRNHFIFSQLIFEHFPLFR